MTRKTKQNLSSIYIPTENPTLDSMVRFAKQGDVKAKKYLQETYKLRVYTHDELFNINKMLAMGLTLDEALIEVNKE